MKELAYSLICIIIAASSIAASSIAAGVGIIALRRGRAHLIGIGRFRTITSYATCPTINDQAKHI